MRSGFKVAHMTTVHSRQDVRILRKECIGLASLGFEVHLFVADGKGDALVSGVHIHDIGAVKGRLRRMLVQPSRMLRAVLDLRPAIAHFHDPELLPTGRRLMRAGIAVIYDAHEDVPGTMLSKFWIPVWLRRPVALMVAAVEGAIARRLSAVVSATPYLAERFARLNRRSVDVNNFPLRSEIEAVGIPRGGGRTICYIGSITRIRCAIEMVSVLERIDAKLILAGNFANSELEQTLRAMPGWKRVDYRGFVNREQARQILEESSVGLVLLYPEPNYVNAQPTKMFEYMAAGLPVLASNFPLYRAMLGDQADEVGWFVDPTNVEQIAESITSVFADPAMARAKGERGRQMALERFTWEPELQKLAHLYDELVPDRQPAPR